jgi:hypothetical protein
MRLLIEIIEDHKTFCEVPRIDMDNWAKTQADKLKKLISDNEVSQSAFNERQKLKREHGAEKWQEVRIAVKAQVKSFNGEMGEEFLQVVDSGGPLIQVKAMLPKSSPIVLNIKFKGAAGPLEWDHETGDPSGKFTLQVGEDGEVRFKAPDAPYPVSATKAAESMLDALLHTVAKILHRPFPVD